MFRLESYVAPLLVGYLNRYINVKAEDLQLRLWGGDAVLNNLELRHDVLHSCIPIPVTVQSARILQLRVHVPWTKLQSESITVTVSTIECILRANYDYKNNVPRPAETKIVDMEQAIKAVEDSQTIPTYFQAYVSRILNNIQLVVHNLIVKFVDSDLALSVNIKSVECFSTNSEWQHAFTDVCGPEWVARKALKITDLTICLDQVNSQTGRIDTFQPPIIYRCNLECRLFFNYFSAAMCANGGLNQNGKSAAQASNNRTTTLLTLTAAPKLSRFSCSAHLLNVSLTDRQLAAALRLTERALDLYARDYDANSSYCDTPNSVYLMTPSSSAGASDLQAMASASVTNQTDDLKLVRNQHASRNRGASQGWLSWALGYVLPLNDATAGANAAADGRLDHAVDEDEAESALFEVEVLIRGVKLALKVADSEGEQQLQLRNGGNRLSASTERDTPAETDNEEPVQSGTITPQIGLRQLQASSSSSASSLFMSNQSVRSGFDRHYTAMHSNEVPRRMSSGSSRVIGATYPIEAIGVSLVDEINESCNAGQVTPTAASQPSRSKYGGVRYRNVAQLSAARCQMTTRLHFGATPRVNVESTPDGDGDVENCISTARSRNRNRNRLMSMGVSGLPPAQLAGQGGIIVTRVGLKRGYEFDVSLSEVEVVMNVKSDGHGKQMVLGSSAIYFHRSCDQNDSVVLGVSIGNCNLRLATSSHSLYLLTPFSVCYKEKRLPFSVSLPLQLQPMTNAARGRRDYCSLRSDPVHAYCSGEAMPSVLACVAVISDFSESVQRAFSSGIDRVGAQVTQPTPSKMVNFEDDLRLGMFEWRTEPVLDGPLHHDVDLLDETEQENGSSESTHTHFARAVFREAASTNDGNRRKWDAETDTRTDAETRDGGVSRIDWDRVFPSSVVCFEVCRGEAAMYWRYAQPRVLVRVRMSPIPFAFARESEADRSVTTSVVVCKLQHFDASANRFLDSLCFTLSDGEPFDSGVLGAAVKRASHVHVRGASDRDLDELECVEAQLWRVLMRTDDVGAITALAAAARIDSSVVISESASLDARLPFIGLSWCDSVLPATTAGNTDCRSPDLAPFTLVGDAAVGSGNSVGPESDWKESFLKVGVSELRIRASVLARLTKVSASARLRADVLDCCALYHRSVLDQLALSADVTLRRASGTPDVTAPAKRSFESVSCETTVQAAGLTLELSSLATILHCLDQIRDAVSDSAEDAAATATVSPALTQTIVVCNDTNETIEVETVCASLVSVAGNRTGGCYRLESGQASLVFPFFTSDRLRVQLCFRVPSIAQSSRTPAVTVHRYTRHESQSRFTTCLVSDSDGLPIPIHVLVRHIPVGSSNLHSQSICQVIVRGNLQFVSLIDGLNVQALLRFAPMAMADGAARRSGRSCTIRPALLDLLLKPLTFSRSNHSPSLLVSVQQVQSVQFRADQADPNWSRVVHFVGTESREVAHSLVHLQAAHYGGLAVWCSVVYSASFGHLLVLSPLFELRNRLSADLVASFSVYQSLNDTQPVDDAGASFCQSTVLPNGSDGLLRVVSANLFPLGSELEQPAAPGLAAQQQPDKLLLGLRFGVGDSRLSRPPLILNTPVLFCKFVRAQVPNPGSGSNVAPPSNANSETSLLDLVYRIDSGRKTGDSDAGLVSSALSFGSDANQETRYKFELRRAFDTVPTVQITVFSDTPVVQPDAGAGVDADAAASSPTANSSLPERKSSWSKMLRLFGRRGATQAAAESQVTESFNGAELVAQQLRWRICVKHCEIIVCDPCAASNNEVDATPFLGVRLNELQADARIGENFTVTKLSCCLKALEVANLLYYYQERVSSSDAAGVGIFHYPTIFALNARRADDADLKVGCTLERAGSAVKLRKLRVACPALLEIFIEDTFIQRVVNLAPTFLQVLVRSLEPTAAPAPTPAPVPAPAPIGEVASDGDADGLRELQVDALTLCLTLKCSPPTIPLCVSLSRSMIRFEPLTVHRVTNSSHVTENSNANANGDNEDESILQVALRHYVRNALFKSGRVIGSLELLGNPSGFFTEMSAGVRDLVRLPASQVQRYGMRYALVGLYSGFESLGTHLLRGSLKTVRSLASSVAQNLDRLSCDADHVARQERARANSPEGAIDGLLGGLTGLGLSLLGAVAGIADHPLRSVVRSEASSRAVANVNGRRTAAWQLLFELNRGIVGLFTKPLSGVAELIALTSQGILHSTGLEATRDCVFDTAYLRALFDEPNSALAPRVTALQFHLLLRNDPDKRFACMTVDAPYRLLANCRPIHATKCLIDLLACGNSLVLLHRERERIGRDSVEAQNAAEWKVRILCTLERSSVQSYQFDPLHGVLNLPIPRHAAPDAKALEEYGCCQQDQDGSRFICLMVDPEEVHQAVEFFSMIAYWS